MTADRCVICGDIIPEGTQVCINCMNEYVGCPWEDTEQCEVCQCLDRR